MCLKKFYNKDRSSLFMWTAICVCVCVCAYVCMFICMDACTLHPVGLSTKLRSQIHSINHRVCVYLGVTFSLMRSQDIVDGIMKRTRAGQTKYFVFIPGCGNRYNSSPKHPDWPWGPPCLLFSR
jgi:hypothetical protein